MWVGEYTGTYIPIVNANLFSHFSVPLRLLLNFYRLTLGEGIGHVCTCTSEMMSAFLFAESTMVVEALHKATEIV